ncbi:MAG TPA: acyltransferase [Terracidiphilus sp.]|nr:acyltransferase [Terracidiphilus sp.]
MEARRPDRLNAITGLRTFAAVNIVFFHFSNPQWFGFLAPVVNAGYASVSYFILLSGFVLAYNYGPRARAGQLNTMRFYKARFTRLYPIYLLSLLMAWRMIPQEYASHTHAMFWTGMVLSPLLLQGWIPEIATFLNTPAWTMSAESFYYVLFPWIARWRRPDTIGPILRRLAVIWFIGLIPGTLYAVFHPDGIAHPDRFSTGPWLQALKFTPLPHLASFLFGVVLAELDELIPREARVRLLLGVGGFGATFFLLWLGGRIPYAMMHDGLLMPLFGCIILGLSGKNVLSAVLGVAPLVFVGEASYALYLLHFNFWNLIHDTHVLNKVGLAQYDPWVSYLILIGLALLALHLVEKPAQRLLRKWMGA